MLKKITNTIKLKSKSINYNNNYKKKNTLKMSPIKSKNILNKIFPDFSLSYKNQLLIKK
jgi:hypothetical protein